MIQYLDFFVSLLGILYLWWEYRAHWLVWVAGIIMPAVDIYLYYKVGLYGDMTISIYYLLSLIPRFGAANIRICENCRNRYKKSTDVDIGRFL